MPDLGHRQPEPCEERPYRLAEELRLPVHRRWPGARREPIADVAVHGHARQLHDAPRAERLQDLALGLVRLAGRREPEMRTPPPAMDHIGIDVHKGETQTWIF